MNGCNRLSQSETLRAGRGPAPIDVHRRETLETACPQAVSIYEMGSRRQTKAGALSFLQADLFQERHEARLGANGIPHGVDFQFWQPGSVLVNRSFEPVAGKVRAVSV